MSSGSKNQKKTWPPTVSGMPSAFYYITLREKCQTIVSVAFARINMVSSQLPSKNRLDKSAKIAYNKSKESTPVDGLLPWIKLWNNRSSLQLGAVISVYCCFARSKWCRKRHCTKWETPSKSSQSLPSGSRIRPPNTEYVPVPMHSAYDYSTPCRILSRQHNRKKRRSASWQTGEKYV